MMAIRAFGEFGDIGAAGAQQYVIVFTQYHTLCTISCNTHDIQLYYICVCASLKLGLTLDIRCSRLAAQLSPRTWSPPWWWGTPSKSSSTCPVLVFSFSRQSAPVLISQFNATEHQSHFGHSGSMQQYQCILGPTQTSNISLTSHVQHSYVRAPCNKYFWQNFFSYCQNHYLESYSLKQIPFENNNYTGC